MPRAITATALIAALLLIPEVSYPGEKAGPKPAEVKVTPRTYDAWEVFDEVSRRGGPRVTIMGPRHELYGKPQRLIVPLSLRFRSGNAKDLVEKIAGRNRLGVHWASGGRVAVLHRKADVGVVSAILGSMSSDVLKARRKAAWLAGWIQDPKVVEGLLRLLSDKDTATAVYAEASILKLGLGAALALGPEQALPVARRTLEDRNWRHAAQALAQFPTASGVSLIAKTLDKARSQVVPRLRDNRSFRRGPARRDPSQLKVLELLDCLGRTGAPETLPTLSRYSRDKDPLIARQAVYCLGYVENKASLAELRKHVTSESAQVRSRATLALGHMASQEAWTPAEKPQSSSQKPGRPKPATCFSRPSRPRRTMRSEAGYSRR